MSETLDSLAAQVRSLQAFQTRAEAWHERHDSMLAKLDKALEIEIGRARATEERQSKLLKLVIGNGQPGLASRLYDIERVIGQLGRLMWLFAVAVGGLFLKLAWEVFTWYLTVRGEK